MVRPPSWLRSRWVIVTGLWSIPGVISTSQHFVLSSYRKTDIDVGRAAIVEFLPWLVWAAATPLIVALRRRWPPVGPRWWAHLPLHLVANAATATVHTSLVYALGRLSGREAFVTYSAGQMIPPMLIKGAFVHLLAYWVLMAVCHGLDVQRRYRETALQRAQLEARLVEAQLDAVKAQLHPHFLFNTLNTISVLMRKGENAGAIKMVGGLADLLRRSLSSLRREFVTLDEELDFIRRYVEIQTTRFSDRLRVVIDVGAGLGLALVPNLILQPIVENAIKHGLASRAGDGSIAIVARSDPDRARLLIEVRDDGVGLGESRHAGTGIGLAHVRQRLDQLYRGQHRFSIATRQPAGAAATMEIPLQLVRPREQA